MTQDAPLPADVPDEPPDDLAQGYGHHLTPPERETIIGCDDAGDTATIWTAQRTIITKLRRNPAARLIAEGTFGTSVWARFEIPADLISFRSPRAPREMTAEARQAFADRMAASRASRDGTPAGAPEDAL